MLRDVHSWMDLGPEATASKPPCKPSCFSSSRIQIPTPVSARDDVFSLLEHWSALLAGGTVQKCSSASVSFENLSNVFIARQFSSMAVDVFSLVWFSGSWFLAVLLLSHVGTPW